MSADEMNIYIRKPKREGKPLPKLGYNINNNLKIHIIHRQKQKTVERKCGRKEHIFYSVKVKRKRKKILKCKLRLGRQVN